MLRSSWILLAVGAALLAPHAGEAETAPGERRYVERGSEVSYRVAVAPLPPRQLGARAAAQLDIDQSAGQSAELPPITGDPSAALAAGWARAGLADDGATRRGRMPLAGRPRQGSCDCATAIGDAGDHRVAALYLERGFEVGDEIDEVRVLELRARYGDGIAVAINGREVVRRNLGDGPMAPASRPRGPELETFYIPVTPGLLRRGANRLSIEVRPSGNELAPSIDVELEPRRGPRIVRGPILQQVSPERALIVFETDLPTRGEVRWRQGDGPAAVARSAGGALAVRHRVALEGLSSVAPVRYRAVAGGDASPEHRFHPAPPKDAPLRFAVYGDMRGGHAVHARIAESIVAEAPAMVLVTGDLVMRGSDEGDWQKLFAVAGDLMAQVPFYPAAGNHDVGRAGAEERRMNEVFALWPGPEDRPDWGHWYSFDVSGVHVVMLDSNAYRHAEQLAWLERDLAAARARGVRAIFAVTHDGPYSRGIHKGNRYAAETYAPVLARYNTSLLFAGHDHMYQRGEVGGLRYIVTGGGGAPLYPIRCGIPGRPRCAVDDGMKKVAREHHYMTVQVLAGHARVCPRRPNREPLEPCFDVPLE